MDLREVRNLIAGGEGQNVEFKRKINFPEKVVRELVAFANTTGGCLLVGVNDDGALSGLRYPEEHDYALRKAIRELCVPPVKFENGIIPLTQKKSVLYYSVKAARRKPLYAKDQPVDKYGTAYVRVEDKTVKASREMTQILRRQRVIKDVKFTYGVKEAILMKFLDQHKNITVKKFMEIASLNKFKASSTLIQLVLADVLKIIPSEKEDSFELFNI